MHLQEIVSGLFSGLLLVDAANQIFRHLYLLVLGALPGAVAGSLIGLAFGRMLSDWVRRSPQRRIGLSLLPWRASIVAGPLFVLGLCVTFIGLGYLPALAAMLSFGFIAAFILIITTFVHNAVPVNAAMGLMLSIRTSLVVGTGFIFILSMIGAGGVGMTILTGMQRLNIELFFAGIGQAVTVTLLLDLLLGSIQVPLFSHALSK